MANVGFPRATDILQVSVIACIQVVFLILLYYWLRFRVISEFITAANDGIFTDFTNHYYPMGREFLSSNYLSEARDRS